MFINGATKLLLAFVCIFALVAIPSMGYHASEKTIEITVKDKWIKPNGDVTKYLIQTTDNGIMSIEDSVLYFAFDSSDRYGNLDVGETYTVTVIGWRIHILSAYPNIVKIHKGE